MELTSLMKPEDGRSEGLASPAGGAGVGGEGRVAAAQKAVQARLAELSSERVAGTPIDSFQIFDANGVQVARVPRSQTINRNWAYRAYFHGQGRDLEPEVAIGPSDRPVLSPVFVSRSTETPRIVVSVAVPAGGHRGAETIGRISMAVDVGRMGLFDGLDRDAGVPLLIETREYQLDGSSAAGLIVDHPDLPNVGGLPRAATDGISRLTAPGWLPEFADPVDGYVGEVAAAPVLIPGRDSREQRSGWVVVVHPPKSD